MIYRKKYVDIKKIQYFNFKYKNLNKLLISSFKNNFYQNYMKRISFYIQKFNVNSNKQFYQSQNKLYCPITFSKKVPNKKIMYSRFYLIKNLNGLIIPPYQK